MDHQDAMIDAMTRLEKALRKYIKTLEIQANSIESYEKTNQIVW